MKDLDVKLEILGVLKEEEFYGHTIEEQLVILKKHYYSRAKELHPDINPNKNGTYMKWLNQAYEDIKMVIRSGFFTKTEHSDDDYAAILEIFEKEKEEKRKRELKNAIKNFEEKEERPLGKRYKKYKRKKRREEKYQEAKRRISKLSQKINSNKRNNTKETASKKRHYTNPNTRDDR